MCSCGSVVKHCVSSAKVVGSIPREHTYWQKKMITWMYCKSLWIKASAKCLNVMSTQEVLKKFQLLDVVSVYLVLMEVAAGLFGNRACIGVQTGLRQEDEVPSCLTEPKRKPQALLRLRNPQCNIDAMPQMKGKPSTITWSTLMSINWCSFSV